MARRKIFLHLGLPDSGTAPFEHSLVSQANALADLGVTVPARTSQEMLQAAVEIRRTHAAWGLKRRDVEGAWATLCRRIHKQKQTAVVSSELLAAAEPDQVDLLLDGLSGTEVHLIVAIRDLATAPDQPDLVQVLTAWTRKIKSSRVHVLMLDDGPDALVTAWEQFADIVGFDPITVPIPEQYALSPGQLDPSGRAVLEGVRKAMGDRVDEFGHREVVQRYFADQVLSEPSIPRRDLPPARFEELSRRAGAWTEFLTAQGYDVHGDLGVLTPRELAETAPGEATTEDTLATATRALADVLVDLAALRERTITLAEENRKLDKKRRKLKKKLAATGRMEDPTDDAIGD